MDNAGPQQTTSEFDIDEGLPKKCKLFKKQINY